VKTKQYRKKKIHFEKNKHCNKKNEMKFLAAPLATNCPPPPLLGKKSLVNDISRVKCPKVETMSFGTVKALPSFCPANCPPPK
jgi:hypothetical protein